MKNGPLWRQCGWNLLRSSERKAVFDSVVKGQPADSPEHLSLRLVHGSGRLALDSIQILLTEYASKNLKSITLLGGLAGDPLEHPDFLSILEMIREHGLVLEEVYTTGKAMHRRPAEALLESGVRRVVFNFGRSESIREERGVDGLANLVALRGENSSPRVVIHYLLDWINIHRLDQMVELAESLRANDLWLEPDLDAAAFVRLQEEDASSVQWIFNFFCQMPQSGLGLRVDAPWLRWKGMLAECGLGPAVPRDEPGVHHCLFSYKNLALDEDGRAFLCRHLLEKDAESVGRVSTGESPTELWKNRSLEEVRRQQRDLLTTRGMYLESDRRFSRLPSLCRRGGQCSLKTEAMEVEEVETFIQSLGLEESTDFSRRLRRKRNEILWKMSHRWQMLSRSVEKRWATFQRWRRSKTIPRTGRRLHIGCGPCHLEGWVNLDIQDMPAVDLVTDITQPWPFREAKAVYAEHFIEHLTMDQVLDFFREAHEALAEEGWMRLSTPNLDWVLLCNYPKFAVDEEKEMGALTLNRAFYGWRHRFLWNQPILESVLEACGFKDLRWMKHGEYVQEEFHGVDRHVRNVDILGVHHVLVVEARKGDFDGSKFLRTQEKMRVNFSQHTAAVG